MSEPVDVAVIGYGPVGAMTALQLEHAGLRAQLFDRRTTAFDIPRAVGIDGESMRSFQRLGLADTFLDVAAHILTGIELRFLRQVTDIDAGLRPCLAVDLGIQPGHDAQQRGLAGAIQAQHADLGARKEGQGNVAQDMPLRSDDLRDAIHCVDVLGHVNSFAG